MDKFRNRAMQVLMGQRAEKLHQEKLRLEEEVIMRKDLRSLQRDRPRHTKSKGTMLDKQRKWIKDLESDAREYKVELRVATSGYQKRRDGREINDLVSSIAKNDRMKASLAELRFEIEVLKIDLRDVDRELTKTNKSIANRKKEAGSFPFRRVDHLRVAQMLGKQLTMNRELIAEIRHLCFEKAIVMKAHSLLRRDIAELSRALNADTNTASKMYGEIRNTKTLMTRLAGGFNTRTKAYCEEMNDFHVKSVVMMDTENFVCTKNKPRFDEGVERRAILRQKPTPNETEREMYRKKAQEYTKKLKIRQVSEIVGTFRNMLDENHSIYRRLGQMLDDNEELTKEITATRKKISGILAEHRRKTTEGAVTRGELTHKMDSCKEKADDMEKTIREMNATINAYLDSTETLLYKLGFTKKDIARLADVVRSIQPSNTYWKRLFGVLEASSATSGQRKLPGLRNKCLSITRFLGEIESYVSKLGDIEIFMEFLRERERTASMPAGVKGDLMPPRPARFETKKGVELLLPTLNLDDNDGEEEADSAPRSSGPIKSVTAHQPMIKLPLKDDSPYTVSEFASMAEMALPVQLPTTSDEQQQGSRQDRGGKDGMWKMLMGTAMPDVF